MKIVEIKNSLAKLYYEPAEFPLLLSDFLTIDDGNQKILSQIVSIESTSKENTNCAILKFSLDINENNTFSSYSGYTPALDAKAVKTSADVLKSIFSSSKKCINMGRLSSSTSIELDINASLPENFLYIQSDRKEQTNLLNSKIIDFNNKQGLKTLVVDFEGIAQYKDVSILELGKDFKLPVGNETLNYIYEHDLAGLTLEQKTIVQDIILEIQEYINTLESGFIPFNTLLEVVNEIYESDKSTGIILLRNKLLKYKQFNIFASSQDEINTLFNSLDNNTVTVLNVSSINKNWQKEALDFAINNIETGYYLIFEVFDAIADKEIINKIYKAKNIKPLINSKYDVELAKLIKSYAKNLILYKPEEQQRAFATYNSFLMKLAQNEFIVSGEATFYTPLIVKELNEELLQIENTPVCVKQEQIPVHKQQAEESAQEETSDIEIEPLEELNEEEDAEKILLPEQGEDSNELKNIFEESLEEEIAKDVDQMFYASSETEELLEETEEIEELEPIEEESETLQEISEEPEINYEEMLSDDDLDMLDNLNNVEEIEEEQIEQVQEETHVQTEEFSEELPELEITENIEETLTENEALPSIPIYKTELDEKIEVAETIKIAEGNIVYHEKYGRGVVEELFNYGKRTLCSIQFDNVGRRLLDPNLAELKQM